MIKFPIGHKIYYVAPSSQPVNTKFGVVEQSIGPEKEIEFSYEPNNLPSIIPTDYKNHLFAYKLTKKVYDICYSTSHRYRSNELSNNSLIVYMTIDEIQEMVNDPQKFWKIYGIR
jgi:hypothetical protein